MKRFATRSIVVAASSAAAATVRARRLRRHRWVGDPSPGHELLRLEHGLGARAPTSAASPAPTSSVQPLATAAGAGSHDLARLPEHRSPRPAQPAVNARDRIGTGPWRNAKGVVVAKNVTELHGANNLNKQTALTEKGDGRQRPRRHAEHARHPDRLAARRHGDRRRGRHDLRQLDQERRGRGDGRPPRSHRPRRERAGEVVELVAPVARLQLRRARRPPAATRASTASPRN